MDQVSKRYSDPCFFMNGMIQSCRFEEFVSEFVPVRTVPELDGWFENIWKDYRTGAIYEK